MSTLNDLVEGIRSSLHSYTGTHEQVTWLTAATTTSATSLTIAGGEQSLRGIAEVGDELIYVQSSTATTLTLAPFGRGYRGTTPVAHAINTPVYFAPAFPRQDIKRVINQSIKALHPTLFRVQTSDLAAESFKVAYELPATAESVLRVEAKFPGDPVADNWVDYARWDFDPHSPVGTGKVLNLYSGVPSGTSLRAVYTSAFGEFTSSADTFASVGLPESYADLITYAATSQMIRFLAPARLQGASVENLSRAQVTQAGDPGQVANQLYAMYQTRLAEERRRLLTLYPAQHNFLSR